MDEVTFVKTKFRMEQWEKLIIDRQKSGLQVDEWCEKKSNKSSCVLLLASQDPEESMRVNIACHIKAEYAGFLRQG